MSRPSSRDGSSNEDSAELEDSLDEEKFDMAALREQRLEQLKREINQLQDMKEQGHGVLTEVTDEKEVIRISANEKLCVIHFYHNKFKRCQIMDKHLEIIASRYCKTRFLRVFVEHVPWLVERLSIKVLPCVICFVDGVAKDRLIGFEDLGSSDEFQTAALELRLQQSGVMQKTQNVLIRDDREDDYDSGLDID